MFVLGHLGIGSAIGRPLVRPAELRWLCFGALLPDLIDKPLYYALAFATGRRAAELGLISGSRTFGHTALFALLVLLLVRGRRGAALAVGMATHLLVDLAGDVYAWLSSDVLHLIASRAPAHPGPGTIGAVLFPLLGPHFPISPFQTVGEHVLSVASAWLVFGELAGAALLFWQFRRGDLEPLSLSSASGSAARPSNPAGSPSRPPPAAPRQG